MYINAVTTSSPSYSADAGTPNTLVSSTNSTNFIFGLIQNDAAGTTFTASCTGLPSNGWLVISWNPAATQPVVDQFSIIKKVNYTSTNTGTVTISTYQPNEIIVLIFSYEKNATALTANTPTATGLTFQRRGGAGPINPATRTNNYMDVYWAPAPSKLSGTVITITTSPNVDSASILAFGVAGIGDINTPWDPNGTLPAFSTSATSTVRPTNPSISTTNANTLMLGAYQINNGGTGVITGWAIVSDFNNGFGALWANSRAFRVGSITAKSSFSVPFSLSADYTVIYYADALVGIAGALTGTVTETASAVDALDAGIAYAKDITESASAVDSVSSLSGFVASITETGTALETISALATSGLSIVETAVALDTVAAVAVWARAIIEVAVAVDEISAVSTEHVDEFASAADRIPVVQQRRTKWFLSFAQVVPPPVGQGPGNPGKLFADFKSVQIYPRPRDEQ